MPEQLIKLNLRQQPAKVSLILATGEHINESLERNLGEGFRVLRKVNLLDDVVEALETEQPEVLLLSRYLPGGQEDLVSSFGTIRRAGPNCRIALLLGEDDGEGREIVRQGTQYGIYNVLVGEDIELDRLREVLTQDRSWNDIANLMPEGFERVDMRPRMVAREADVPQEPAQVVPKIVTKYAKIIGVVSGKANVGKTTVSTNLLAAAKESGAIGVDMDYNKPDLLLHFMPENNQRADLRDLFRSLNLPSDMDSSIKALDRQDASIVADWMDKLPEAMPGVTVVPGPSRGFGNIDVPRALAGEILRYAAQKSRLVVADAAFEIADESTLDLLFAADMLLVVTTPDQSSVYQTAWFLQQLEDMHVPKGKLRLVVTRAGQKGLKSPAEVAQSLGIRSAFSVPYDPRRHETARISRKPTSLREGPKGVFHAFLQEIIQDTPQTKRQSSPFGFLHLGRKEGDR